MKVYLFFVLLAWLSCPGLGSAQIPFFATVRGTITAQETNSSGTRLVTGRLDNARICEEFGVSPQNYAVVVMPRTSAVLQLRPRNSSSALPVIEVLRIAEDSNSMANSKTGSIVFEAPISSTVSNNVFTSLRGTLSGRGRLNAERNDFQKASIDVIGSGNMVNGKRAILKLHVNSGRMFRAEE